MALHPQPQSRLPPRRSTIDPLGTSTYHNTQTSVAILTCSYHSPILLLLLANFHTQAPVVALLLFGLYLFIWLILGVATFRTVPEEAESLQVDIARAKKELAKRGIKIT